MNYKKRYKRQKNRNKILVDRIEDLKSDILNMKNTQSDSMDEVYDMIKELDDIRLEFLSVIRDLERCKDLYKILRNMYIRKKKLSLFFMKITDVCLNIKYKIIDTFKYRKYK